MLGSDPPPPPARQEGQPQPKPPSRHGDQGGGGGGWANGLPCHPPPAKQFSSRLRQPILILSPFSMPLNTSTTYHAPPPCCNFFCQHTNCKNVYRDEGVILSHICWGLGAPLPFSRPQTPPPRPEIGWKVGGSWRMARWYAPPPPPCNGFWAATAFSSSSCVWCSHVFGHRVSGIWDCGAFSVCCRVFYCCHRVCHRVRWSEGARKLQDSFGCRSEPQGLLHTHPAQSDGNGKPVCIHLLPAGFVCALKTNFLIRTSDKK